MRFQRILQFNQEGFYFRKIKVNSYKCSEHKVNSNSDFGIPANHTSSIIVTLPSCSVQHLSSSIRTFQENDSKIQARFYNFMFLLQNYSCNNINERTYYIIYLVYLGLTMILNSMTLKSRWEKDYVDWDNLYIDPVFSLMYCLHRLCMPLYYYAFIRN